MNKILFEVSYIGNPQILLDIAIIILGIILTIIDMKRKKKKYNANLESRIGYKIEQIGNVIMLVFLSGLIIALGITYGSTVLKYKRGNYREVKGRVEEFVKIPHHEEFKINGVEFRYGVDLMWGYTLTLRKSVITGDGQYLRIRYIPTGKNNEIVYIEEIVDDVKQEGKVSNEW